LRLGLCDFSFIQHGLNSQRIKSYTSSHNQDLSNDFFVIHFLKILIAYTLQNVNAIRIYESNKSNNNLVQKNNSTNYIEFNT